MRLRLIVQALDLEAGPILMLDADAPHDVEALGESAFFLTIAWPAKTHQILG